MQYVIHLGIPMVVHLVFPSLSTVWLYIRLLWLYRGCIDGFLLKWEAIHVVGCGEFSSHTSTRTEYIWARQTSSTLYKKKNRLPLRFFFVIGKGSICYFVLRCT